MKKLILATLFLTLNAQAVEIYSTPIRVALDYADIDYSCKLWPMAERFVLSAEVDSGVVTRAKIRNRWANTTVEGIELTAVEKSGIVLVKTDGRWRLTGWALTPRLVDLFLHSGANQGFDSCTPPKKLLTVEPGAVKLEFTTSSAICASQEVEFQGVTEEQVHYRMRLQLELPALLNSE